jgi:hypothetical protein
MNDPGFTAQFVTIAIALRIQLCEYFERAAIAQKHSRLDGLEEFEARRLTIILLVASLCECCINTALALSLPPKELKKIERDPTLKKWRVHSSRVNPQFKLLAGSELESELEFIFECRNSTTHAHPEVFSPTSTIHPGNHQPWAQLTHERVLRVARVPNQLLAGLCRGSSMMVSVMQSDVAEQLRLADFETKQTN